MDNLLYDRVKRVPFSSESAELAKFLPLAAKVTDRCQARNESPELGLAICTAIRGHEGLRHVHHWSKQYVYKTWVEE